MNELPIKSIISDDKFENGNFSKTEVITIPNKKLFKITWECLSMKPLAIIFFKYFDKCGENLKI